MRDELKTWVKYITDIAVPLFILVCGFAFAIQSVLPEDRWCSAWCLPPTKVPVPLILRATVLVAGLILIVVAFITWHREREYEEAKRMAAAWEEDAKRFAQNAEYYQGIVDSIGRLFPECFIQDDGRVVPEPLRAKVLEVVKERLAP